MSDPLPAGYVRVRSAEGHADGVVLEALARSMADVLEAGTIYDYAARATGGATLEGGRGPAYAIPFGGVPAVVRHVRHGGAMAPLTRDLFLPPTRAPHELAASIRLRQAGVATPQVLGYVVYRAGAGLRRADVVTREILGGIDLAKCLRASGIHPDSGPLAARTAAWEATRVLIDALARAGAYHADLNVTNVLLTFPEGPRPNDPPADGPVPDGPTPIAYALDIDRVVWRRPGDPAVVRANTARLHRSARKLGLL